MITWHTLVMFLLPFYSGFFVYIICTIKEINLEVKLDKLNNVSDIFGDDILKEQINKTLKDAIVDSNKSKIINCMIILVDENDEVIYSYSNLNKHVTMIGALEILKGEFNNETKKFNEEVPL